jgi:reactive intermediate/imine deaminase
MAVVPLIAVAWADGNVQDEERKAINAAAQAAGIQPQDGRYPMLEYWMNKRPGAPLIEAWEHYIKDLCKRLDKPEIEELKHDVLSLAQGVAQAAGGDLNNIVKLTVFLTDLTHFPLVNQIMAEYFQSPYPARAVVGVAALPKSATIEMDAILVLPT